MLIHNTLPKKYFNSIEYVYNYYKNKNLEGNHSVHYWINQVGHPTLQYHLLMGSLLSNQSRFSQG